MKLRAVVSAEQKLAKYSLRTLAIRSVAGLLELQVGKRSWRSVRLRILCPQPMDHSDRLAFGTNRTEEEERFPLKQGIWPARLPPGMPIPGRDA